ncbi:T9SS type A sorting domain-containing protein, partial [Rhodocytophaga aerolata]|uniref:T9SS type A sorting domain-containing protein n=1 Tax=Rhodocytophaga aerolata TaxID=455078 RepID=UPI00360D7197
DFEVSITDGRLDVSFTPTANRVAIAGMEIYNAGIACATAAVAPASTARSLAEEVNAAQSSSNEVQLNVYPNPSLGGQIYLDMAGFGSSEEVVVQVVDGAGQVIMLEREVSKTDGTLQISLPIAKRLKPGLYIVSAYSKTGKVYKKLVVQ